MSGESNTEIVDRLRRWAAARERRNGPNGFGSTGTELLRQAARAIERLDSQNEGDGREPDGTRLSNGLTIQTDR